MASSTTQRLLHPELMSNEQIINILTSRCIQLSNKEQLTRSELLDIYCRIALPLEQRNCSSKRKLIEKSDIQEARTDSSIVKTCVVPSRKIKINRSNQIPNEHESQTKISRLSDGINKQCSLKRSSEMTIGKEEPIAKKVKQKITWP